MITFEYLNKKSFIDTSKTIFDILADNMSVIAPTGNSKAEDYSLWFNAVSLGLEHPARQIVLIKNENEIIGFFQYYTNADTFMMEEIQIKPKYQGRGVFRALYGFLIPEIKNSLKFVEAYANIKNTKSIAILQRLGLSNIGLNRNGSSYHFKGEYSSLVKWSQSK